ncbi:mechanosensitive ion channel [Mycolicibacterium fluoranthenivorans]|jgi:small-conductance mechanosensitive channel/CRP-like cAMP-binding protein|uniref:Mechanosensitive ion channel n=1 Tax=Mycolicibacterium fluoranthenivorans TaxID=258505 RepID=A0A1G4VUZ6_9MYCO|nr:MULTISPECIES: mechanosensitive ion channel family protein [Mycobacteriaceae]MCV7251995.1 mechanosensitive ion channel [Mycobacterium hackensackense]QNJ95112.1 mechanosensitive ion channel [Mycolicibacterium fluoranthenivorans]SCX12341.1 Small-conductance mechanosensitive channel [Mycolicibacterium fluoranthenivorans]
MTTDVFTSSWFYWAVGIAIGLPIGLVLLTEWQHALRRKQSALARPVTVMRNYLLPLGALLLLLTEARQVPAEATSVRTVATLFAFVVLVLLLSGVNATLFQGAPAGTWRKRVPTIFVDVGRFVLIAVGLALIFSYIWGANVRGLFTALGITSIVIGLTLQNSVGQIISGLLMLFEQPFQLGDWLDTAAARGRVVEVNWRAVHLETSTGLQITPNSVLAGASFTNLSRPGDKHKITVTTIFSLSDPPNQVCALLTRVASELPQLRPGGTVSATPVGGLEYRTTIPLTSPAEDGPAKTIFLQWIWYASRRAGLHLDEAADDFTTPERIAAAVAEVVAPTLRLNAEQQQELIPSATLDRYGADEVIQRAGEVPDRMTFILAGRVALTTGTGDEPRLMIGTLEEGGFLGQSTLTRQPVIGYAHALSEVTVVHVDREHIELVVQRNPLLLQEFGRAIEDRRASARRVLSTRTEG